MNRTVQAVMTYRGERLGTVGPLTAETQRWQEIGTVARQLESALEVPVLVLRLISVEGGSDGQGGLVTYHAEALRRPETPLADEASIALDEEPLRADWATADGLRSAVSWAEESLRSAGRAPVGRAEQVKTWNLSGLVRIPTAEGPAWLKSTPRFGACEAEVISLFASVDAGLVPTVLAADTPARRVLLDHVPGEDCWGVPDDAMLATVERFARAQAALTGRAGTLPDRTPTALVEEFRTLLARGVVTELTADETAQAHRLADRLPAMAEELADCGLPETVLHGDFHPGNWRSDGSRTVVVDFSDACLGHPAFDGLRPRPFCSPERWAQVRDRWVRAWSELVPGSDPSRALELAAPLMHLSYAVVYQRFLDNIEPSERIYHAGDPAAEIRRALRSV